MCDPPFTRDEENRLRALQKRQETGEVMSPQDTEDFEKIQTRYQSFIEEGQKRLREGAGLTPAPATPASVVAESLSKAGRAAYFWGSLVATAVPGYIGRKAGVTSEFTHWNTICDRVILGALPVCTQVGSSGNHLVMLKEQLTAAGQTLGMVVACLEDEELDGFGINVIEFVKEEDWREYVNEDVEYVRVPMEDTTAKVSFDVVANTVELMERCVSQRKQTVYVHCKAGKGRSWMMVICYLVTYGGLPYEAAEKLVEVKRPQVSPSVAQQCFAREFPVRFARWRSMRDAQAQQGSP